MADKKNILSKKNKTEKEELKDFLKDNLSSDLLHSINNEEDPFLQDALEGLESFSSVDKIHHNVQQLNKKLHRSTRSKRKSRPFEFKQIFWFVLAVVIIILLVLLGFEVLSLRK